MHFRIRKIIATSGFLTALECTKFDFGRRSPRLPSWFKGGGLLLRGGEGKGRERRRGKGEKEVGRDRERGDWKRRGREARGRGGKRRGNEEEGEEGREDK